MPNQPKCAKEGCNRTAIPGRSPHGLCLQHEKEIEKGILKRQCMVKGCGTLFTPSKDNEPICEDCRRLADKVWWILQFTRPKVKKETAGGLVLPGQKPLPSVTEIIKSAKGG